MNEDQEVCMALAEPLLRGVHDVLYDAMAFYQGEDYSAKARAEHSNRAAANVVYDHAEKAMIRRFDGMAGVSFINKDGLHVLNYFDRVVLRFKKVKPSGKHANYQTQRQQDYDDQKIIPGLPEAAKRLTAGYQLSVGGDAIERVMIARPLGRAIAWAAQIVALEERATWHDITPDRLAGMQRTDFDASRARRRR